MLVLPLACICARMPSTALLCSLSGRIGRLSQCALGPGAAATEPPSYLQVRASAAGSAGVRPRRLMCTHGRRRHTPPAAVRQITDSCRRSRCPRHWRGRARRARTSARQVLPTPQGADVAFVQFEDNWRPRHARRANRGGGAVCGRRRAEAFVAAFAATGQRGRAEAEAKPMFKALRAVTPRLQRFAACACHSRNVTSRQRYSGNVTKSSFTSQL
jgi:hypothetical protein